LCQQQARRYANTTVKVARVGTLAAAGVLRAVAVLTGSVVGVGSLEIDAVVMGGAMSITTDPACGSSLLFNVSHFVFFSA